MALVGKKRKQSGKSVRPAKKRKTNVSDTQEPQTTTTTTATNSTPKPRKLRVEPKYELPESSSGKVTPLRKSNYKRRGNAALKKVYYPDKGEEEERRIPLRTTPKQNNKKKNIKKTYFPSSQELRASSSEEEEESDVSSSSDESDTVEGLAGEESLVMESDTGSSASEEDGVYEEDEESIDDDDDDDDDDQKPLREARLLSNVGTAADDIGFVDIDQDDEEEIEDGDEDDDEDAPIVQHVFGGDPDGWGDLVKASKNVELIHSQKKKEANYSKKQQKHKFTGKFKGLVRVKNFPHGFYEDGMRAFFSQFGNVGRCVVARNPKTHQPAGYAMVEFRTPEIAEIAAEAMDGYMMFHNMLKVTAEKHPGPILWTRTALNVKPVARYDVPALLYNKAASKVKARHSRAAQKTLNERLVTLLHKIKIHEKELKGMYGVQYHYEADPVVPDCSGSRVSLESNI